MPIFDAGLNYQQTGAYRNSQKTTEYPFLGKVILKLAADEEDFNQILESLDTWTAIRRSISCMKELSKLSIYQKIDRNTLGLLSKAPASLPAAIAEVFAARLAPKCGVRVPEVMLSEQEPGNFDSFVKERNGVWVVSKRIPCAVPVFYIKNANRVPSDNPLTKNAPELCSKMDNHLEAFFYNLLDKRCPVSRKHYSDFPVESESEERVLRAVNWSSEERLLGHAFRLLLNVSFAHSSNTLVNTDGKIFLIDFEKCLFEPDPIDVEGLYGAVKHSEKVLNVCRQISMPTEQDIDGALSGIEEKYWNSERAVFNDATRAAEYFKQRLRVWKSLFQPVAKALAA